MVTLYTHTWFENFLWPALALHMLLILRMLRIRIRTMSCDLRNFRCGARNRPAGTFCGLPVSPEPEVNVNRAMTWSKMATSKGSPSELRTEFSTKEGTYKNVKASEHSRPSRQPLFGKELSPVQVSTVSCKDKEGVSEFLLFNSGKELYFYPFDGVGQVCEWPCTIMQTHTEKYQRVVTNLYILIFLLKPLAPCVGCGIKSSATVKRVLRVSLFFRLLPSWLRHVENW